MVYLSNPLAKLKLILFGDIEFSPGLDNESKTKRKHKQSKYTFLICQLHSKIVTANINRLSCSQSTLWFTQNSVKKIKSCNLQQLEWIALLNAQSMSSTFDEFQ